MISLGSADLAATILGGLIHRHLSTPGNTRLRQQPSELCLAMIDQPHPFAIAVNILVFTIQDDKIKILLRQRDRAPFRDRWVLPGGWVQSNEALPEAAARTLREQTNITTAGTLRGKPLSQFRSYYEPQRYPRRNVTTIVYWAIVTHSELAKALVDSPQTAATWPYKTIDRGRIDLAFDHKRIIREGLKRTRRRLEGTTVATRFLPKRFTISDLRRVYELMWDTTDIDPGNFQRKVLKCQDFLKTTTDKRPSLSSGPPATLYTAGPARFLTSTIVMPNQGWL